MLSPIQLFCIGLKQKLSAYLFSLLRAELIDSDLPGLLVFFTKGDGIIFIQPSQSLSFIQAEQKRAEIRQKSDIPVNSK